MKKLIAVLLAVVLLGTLTACYVAPDNNDTQGSGTTTTTKPQENPPALSIAAIQGPTGVGLVNLMAAKDNGTAKLDYDFVVCSSPEEVVGKVKLVLQTPNLRMSETILGMVRMTEEQRRHQKVRVVNYDPEEGRL